MSEPHWIEEPVVLALHLDQLNEFGGLAGIRDHGLLLSALARAKNVWAFSSPKPDIGIAKNHPFFDSNKRTSLVVCHTFLRVNGSRLIASQSAQVDAILKLAAGEWEESQSESWLREYVVEASQEQ